MKTFIASDIHGSAYYCRRLSERFTDDQEYIEKEIAGSGPRVQCLCLKIEHMTGKRVTES